MKSIGRTGSRASTELHVRLAYFRSGRVDSGRDPVVALGASDPAVPKIGTTCEKLCQPSYAHKIRSANKSFHFYFHALNNIWRLRRLPVVLAVYVVVYVIVIGEQILLL